VLVLTKRESSSLAAAYGLAVTGSMTCTSILYAVVARSTWGWSAAKTGLLVAVFLSFDLPFLSANVLKIPDGGYIPLFIGAAFVTSMLIWRRGRLLLSEQYAQRFPPFDEALPRIEQRLVARVPGTAVFMASNASHVPPVLMHHVERSRTLHENVVMLTVRTAETPYVPSSERVELSALGGGFHRVLARYGFMEQPDVVAILELSRKKGLAIDTTETTYYLGRETIVSAPGGKMGSTAEKLFAFLQRNALTADRHFGVPPKQVVELGTQVDL
jgi:KUP system potassium uptake protein